MCAPVIVAAVGAAISMKQQKDAADYDAAVAKNNAKLAEYQGQDAIQRGASEARAIEIEGRRIKSEARTSMAASGVSDTSGSAANLLTASDIAAARDAERVRANAAREAWGFRNEAQDTRAQGQMNKRSGYLGAIGTGVGGVGSALSAYSQSRKNG